MTSYSSTDPCGLSAEALVHAYAAGELAPSSVLDAVLARRDLIDPQLNLFATRDDAGARRMAEASDARWRAGQPLGPLDGVPIAIKDNIPVAGLRCAWGSKLFLDYIPTEDELPVARLRAGGAVLLGKTNVSEFTLGRGNVSTRAFGTTRNPWDPALTTGASTGGGAAAVATGIGPLGLGTDGGGSIRWPASYTGLVGLKPSTGRIARRHGLPVVLNDLEVIAPIGRTVGDVARLLDAVAAPDPHDRASLAFRAPPPMEVPRSLRILYVGRFGDYAVEPEIVASTRAAAQRLAAMGHAVEEGPVPFDFARFDTHWRTIGTSGLAWLLRDRPGWEAQVGEIYPPMVEAGRSFTAADYVDALNVFRTLFDQMASFFETYDLLLTPVAGAMPWSAAELAPVYQRVFTGFANVTGLPAISLPGPPSPTGIPIGFQLVAPFAHDERLLTIGRAYEAAYPWADRWPAMVP